MADFNTDPFAAVSDLLGNETNNVNNSSNVLGKILDFPVNKPAVYKRHLINFLVPNGPIVNMYVNPQNIRYNYKKDIVTTKTKGGYLAQYFGLALTTLTVSGTTGSSGIEGINVLYLIYLNEQFAFDPVAQVLAQQNSQSLDSDLFGSDSALNSALGAGTSLVGALLGDSNQSSLNATSNTPTLASIAFGIEIFYNGQSFRGWFNDFNVTENAQTPGLFDYEFGFTVTQITGLRQNFLPWHRSANHPSDSNPITGVPYSFGYLSGNGL